MPTSYVNRQPKSQEKNNVNDVNQIHEKSKDLTNAGSASAPVVPFHLSRHWCPAPRTRPGSLRPLRGCGAGGRRRARDWPGRRKWARHLEAEDPRNHTWSRLASYDGKSLAKNMAVFHINLRLPAGKHPLCQLYVLLYIS
jgi:hypothetical protein